MILYCLNMFFLSNHWIKRKRDRPAKENKKNTPDTVCMQLRGPGRGFQDPIAHTVCDCGNS